MMRERFVNLMIISDEEGIKTYSIPSRKLMTNSLFYIFLFFLIVAAISYNKIMLRMTENEQYALTEKLHSEMAKMDKEIEKMEAYIDKINLMVEDEMEISKSNSSQQYGIGGGDEYLLEKEINNSLVAFENTSEIKRNIYEKLEYLDGDLKLLTMNLRNMIEKLASTPSIFPVNGMITSPFGYRKSPFTGRKEFHRGIDILNKEGTPIIAPANGVVKKISTNPHWGLNILISHGNKIETQYGHLLESFMEEGQKVKRGNIIGTLGKSGRTTGPHLHYQIWINGTPVNPLDYVVEGELETVY